ncbi:DUF445 domain-containing protein [Desulforamulus aquiferis]|uniref:DUF445 family protein n=1 Tax=Desulforamulus aquiferis TaxID=1397668 RepID=A0AAW7ZBI6_9FIRM|nr:DUF445 family protein [Desulforamulus aquiferis]MDO7786697.1 DUF445 family protein [Desulforamulus aquiferis]RYD06896.1 hypothetical protein N752_01850 [Desulforamulus aquiferis]
MEWWVILLIPVIGAFIGWVTNLIAVKAIFKPYQPVKIPGLPWVIQGVVPKRRAELAKSIGEVVERELLKVEDLMGQMKSPEVLDGIIKSASESIHKMIVDKIPAWVPTTVRAVILEMMGDMLQKQMPQVINQIIDQAGSSVIQKVRLSEIVEERLNAYEVAHLEKIILTVASRELKHIEIIGGILGFIIGLIQVGLVYMTT